MQAGNQQRANQPISADQQKGINKLYARLARDNKKRMTMAKREERIRARFAANLERYRFLTSDNDDNDEEQADQG
jgi:hypothetical protein